VVFFLSYSCLSGVSFHSTDALGKFRPDLFKLCFYIVRIANFCLLNLLIESQDLLLCKCKFVTHPVLVEVELLTLLKNAFLGVLNPSHEVGLTHSKFNLLVQLLFDLLK